MYEPNEQTHNYCFAEYGIVAFGISMTMIMCFILINKIKSWKNNADHHRDKLAGCDHSDRRMSGRELGALEQVIESTGIVIANVSVQERWFNPLTAGAANIRVFIFY